MTKTLLQLAGADPKPSALAESVLVIVDAQNEYLEGPLALSGVDAAMPVLAGLLARARDAGTPVVHIAHKGRAGGAFDRDDRRGQIADAVAPQDGEPVIEKGLPNSFAGTTLKAELDRIGERPLIVAGFMTHMCVSSTLRAALDLGYRSTLAGDACATRDLPDPMGGVIKADTIHRSALAALADRFACVVMAQDIPG